MTNKSNRQIYHSSSDKKRLIPGLIIIILILLGCVAAVFLSTNKKYRPPELDPNRSAGIPHPEDNYLYETVNTDYGYSFGIAANLYQQKDGSVNVFLSNPAENTVSLMCEIKDAADKTVYYRCGRINPGEYVEKLSPSTVIKNEAKSVIVKIYAFEAEDYTSAGSVELKLVLQPW